MWEDQVTKLVLNMLGWGWGFWGLIEVLPHNFYSRYHCAASKGGSGLSVLETIVLDYNLLH